MQTLIGIRSGLEEAQRTVSEYFGGLTLEELFRHRPGEWSPMQDVRHLTRTNGTLARTLALPRPELHERFGPPAGPSATYEELEERYRASLRGGFRAPARFDPPEEDPDDPEAYRTERLARWHNVAAGLLATLDAWDDDALDRFAIPHPALGTLTVREMLMFARMHNLHHVEVARRRLAG